MTPPSGIGSRKLHADLIRRRFDEAVTKYREAATSTDDGGRLATGAEPTPMK